MRHARPRHLRPARVPADPRCSRTGLGRIHQRGRRVQNCLPGPATGAKHDVYLAVRLYAAGEGVQRDIRAERFSVTAVDFRGIQQQAIAKACPKGPDTCQRRALTAVIGEGEWRNDVRGAMLYALNTLINRDAKITNITGDWQDLVDGMMVQLTNADQSRTFASISMHDNRLYHRRGHRAGQ